MAGAVGLQGKPGALRLHSEIAAVVTALRQRQWAWQVPGRYNVSDQAGAQVWSG